MWLEVGLPDFAASGAEAHVARLHAVAGERLERGAALIDLTVDFSAGVMRDCPPVATFRIVLQEAGWLRTMPLAAGDPVSGPIALLSTERGEALRPPARAARVSVATVLHHDDWWTAG